MENDTSYMNGFYTDIEAMGVVPVVVLDDVKDALPLAKVLEEGGLPSAEVTFRTSAAADSIREIAKKCPDVLVGAGTVLNVEQAQKAVDAGAKFIVSPGTDRGVVDWCLTNKVPVMPAGVTPTEITALVNAGLNVTKFFPAALCGGLKTIGALASVFVGHRFMPTGGVNASNLSEYLAHPAIIACGGTWMVKPDLIHAANFDKILSLTKEARDIVEAAHI
jgi:2-dehydro-3-deoxyphosphogluconate aldolase/(4S)-4-hydroxy-2-oxoglutarate aldolase